MPYYTRVFSKRPECPSYDELVAVLRAKHPKVVLSVDGDDDNPWSSLELSHDDGEEIAVIERNPVAPESLGEAEVSEFLEDIQDCKPASAVAWLTSFLGSVKAVYAFQHLSGSDRDGGSEALRAVSEFIWSQGDAILQADGEGFSNEDGYHILWQFSDSVDGPWWMAVLRDGTWVRFQMDLGNLEQRRAFFEGRIPPDATLAEE